jgi:hypothetical protein
MASRRINRESQTDTPDTANGAPVDAETKLLDKLLNESGAPNLNPEVNGSLTDPATGSTVDASTGEMRGDNAPPVDEVVDTDVVALPKKIVAKEIIGRAQLKCSKKFIAEKDKEGNAIFDSEGAPKGIWDVTPPTALYTVFGTASGTETGETQFGDWTGFEGTFEAVRASDGKRFRSNRLILQEPAQGLLLNALTEVKRRDPSGSVNFAFNVGKRTSQRWVDTNDGNSYEYTIESVINVVKHDPLAHMRKALSGILPKAPPKQLTSDGAPSAPTA